MIRLYHGSNVSIDQIDLSKSKLGKDFGKGFYLNPDFNQAWLWANSRTKTFETGEPIVTSYEFDIDRAKEDGLNIKIFDDYSAEWAEFIVKNRRNSSNELMHEYDIVIGPIADDNVGRQIQFYMHGYWTIDQLIEKIKYYGKISIQYFFANQKSLNYLNKIQ